ncbi:MAG: tRNA (cytidine(34)-2'-O)-methyltransferase [Pirellulales bacterium]|nr:tRNA (cytidine(34)-2'-O)-methyltransferase [Pirellulales bacterium]
MTNPPLDIVLVEPEIAHNTGSVGRTCVALGAKLWLVRPLGFQLDDRRLRRAGLDYWKSLDWQTVDDWDELTRRLPDRRFWLLTKRAKIVYTKAAFAPGDVLVFGSESRGLPRSLTEKHKADCLKIPMRPEARSLNLAVSAAVVAYEARRQIESVSRGL